MTKSVSHSDMDDVLSSIKRLVTDPAVGNEGHSVNKSSLLLLTPALRVDHDDELAADIAAASLDLSIEPEMFRDADAIQPEEAETFVEKQPDEDDASPLILGVGDAHQPEPAENARPLSPLEQRIAELEQAVGRTGEQWEPDGSEPQEAHQPKLHFLERYRKVGEEAWAAAARPVQPEDDVAADLSKAFEDEVPDGPEDAALSPIEPERETDTEVAKIPEPMPAAAPAPEMEAEEEIVFDSSRNREPPLQLGQVAMFSHTPNRTPPAEDIEAETAEAHSRPEPAQTMPVETHISGGELDLYDADDDLLVDEEMLRSLVSDIVRDELQGRMGERITRNVRRMVRQEIERALQLRSLK